MNQEISLIRLQEHHLPLIRQWRNENRSAFFDETEVSEEMHQEWWKRHEHQVRVGREDFWVIRGPHGLVGQASLYNINADRTAEFGRMIVLPPFRRQGYGTQIVSEVCQWAQSAHGVRRIDLAVRADNLAAYRLYRSCGFVLTEGPRPPEWPAGMSIHKMMRVMR